MDLTTVPPTYHLAATRWGDPVGVEEARRRWSELVESAEQGTITLIALDRAGPGWVALAPVSELVEPLAELPVWPLSQARPKVGELVRAAGGWHARPVVLTRHRRPVAALVSAAVLSGRPTGPDRASAEDLLQDGGTITLAWDPGEGGRVADGEVIQDPEPSGYTATARDHAGAEIAHGAGESPVEALLGLWRAPAADPDSEPPF